ncbi:hypothetical protein QZR43_13025 [Serratia marcescens]|uniref:hypothetical protein n=1 Tax=Serratia marcescens TaxID=615 RepID=UPI0027737CB7|nr:hypothetical protein [Serratia marcescens]MDP8803905.1 hypothetical protein [Serratia marcescens]
MPTNPSTDSPPAPATAACWPFAADELAVKRAYAAGLLAGGCSEGEPGERAHYGKGYFGAYLRDPDGNKVHVVYRGDLA